MPGVAFATPLKKNLKQNVEFDLSKGMLLYFLFL